MKTFLESTGHFPAESGHLRCGICGASMYATHKGNWEITYHCSSSEARFWDFDRGTADQAMAKQHWDQSIHEVFLTRVQDRRSA